MNKSRKCESWLTTITCPLLRTLPLQMLVFYTWTVRNVSDAISLMSAAEKIGWLASKTPQEGEALYTNTHSDNSGVKDSKDAGKLVVSVQAGDGGAPSGWPRRGTIEFENVWMKYLPSAPFALKGELTAPKFRGSDVMVVGKCWCRSGDNPVQG